MDYTRKLADFCAGISLAELPAEVTAKAKLCVLDYVANVYGSAALEAVQRVASGIRALGGPPTVSAFGWGFKTGIHDAAFLNGTTGEAIEAQDGLRFGGNHPGTAVIPAAFAVAEARGLGGAAVLEGVVAGYEAAGRTASAVHPLHTLSGFLPTGTCGTFGAAAAASKVMSHDAEGMLNALANAGYLLPLSMAEHLMGGYTVKIVQGGQAASAGIRAAELAGVGITGAPYVLEGSHLNGGFIQITMKGDAAPDRIVDRLGEHFSIMDIYFKPYTACRHTHGAAQAALALTAEGAFTPDEIEAIDVHTYAIATIAVGKQVTEESSFVTAQFSIPYVVAVCLLDGDMGPDQMCEDRISDPAVIALSKKVTLHADEALNNAYPELTGSRVEIRLTGGRTLSKQIDIPRGDPRDPMTEADLAYKTRRFASGKDEDVVTTIIETILELETVGEIGALTRLL